MTTAWASGTTITVHRKLTSNGFIIWYCKINNKDEGSFMTRDEAETYAWLRTTTNDKLKPPMWVDRRERR